MSTDLLLATRTFLLGEKSSIVSNNAMSFVTLTVAPLSAVHECFLCFLVRNVRNSKTVGVALGHLESYISFDFAGLRFRTTPLVVGKYEMSIWQSLQPLVLVLEQAANKMQKFLQKWKAGVEERLGAIYQSLK